MTVQRSHGRPFPLVARPDELPAGVPGDARPAEARDPAGRLLPGPGTSALAREAAQARWESARLAQLMGLVGLPEDQPYAPYRRMALEWRDAHLSELAATVGGGTVGPGPASVVSTAALQLGASRYLHDLGVQGGDARMLLDASRLADASRQSLLAAHELAAREAAARPRKPSLPWQVPSPAPAPKNAPARQTDPQPATTARDGGLYPPLEGSAPSAGSEPSGGTP